MSDTKKRSVFAVLGFAISMAIAFVVSPALAETGQNEQTGLPVVKAGPLEISPGRVGWVLEAADRNTLACFRPAIGFKIENTSSADVRVILFTRVIQVTDELGYVWFTYGQYSIESGGVPLSKQDTDSFARAFKDEKAQFVTLSPQQTVEARLVITPGAGGYLPCFPDKDNDFAQTHRPKTITFNALIGIISLDNQPEIRVLSFSDLPVAQISAW